MKGNKEKCDDGGEIQGLGQVWKQPARKVWRSSRSFVEECSHKVSSAAGPKSERTVSQRPTDERMERAQLVALLLPKRFMICALNLFINCATRLQVQLLVHTCPTWYRCAYPLSPRTQEP
jgi:hypothetical protein